MSWINENKNWLFDGAGVTVGLSVLGGLAWLARFLWQHFSIGRKLSDFASKRNMKRISDLPFNPPFSQIAKRARILVIDDEEEAFPCRLLQNEGYDVTYWSAVQHLKPLVEGDYDVIVLDINGVADKNISMSDGLGIIEYIKRHNPAQLIVAYSGRKFDLSKQAFWKIADECLGKPSPLTTCKEKIDSLLKAHFTPVHYWSILEGKLRSANLSTEKIDKLEHHVCEVVTGKQDFRIEELRTRHQLPADVVAITSSTIKTLLHLFGVS
jgi:CheY-like chemotaxis protein